ncbi:BH0509 family protein [Sutcliffiella halmapala]|nr:BH0509 family protein [Sutcliffiella halmapala]
MSRQERKNMIKFIEVMKKVDRDSLLYMTDADIEHLYNNVYEQMMIHESL